MRGNVVIKLADKSVRVNQLSGDPQPGWRILVVTHGYPPRQIAGAEQQVRRKVRWWYERGHSVSVVALDPHLAVDAVYDRIETSLERVDDIDVHRLCFAVPDASRPLVDTYRHPTLVAALDRHIESFRPDFVYQVSGTLLGVVPTELATTHGLPSVLFATDYWHLCQRHTLLRPDGMCCPGPRHPADCAACRLTARHPFSMLGPRVQRASWSVAALAGRRFGRVPGLGMLGAEDFRERAVAVQRALDNIDLVICNSAFLTDRMRDLGVKPERILTVRQGIEPLPGVDATTVDTETNGVLRVLYLGQISRHKGVDLLASAARQLLDEGIPLTLRIHGPATDGSFSAVRGQDARIQLHDSLSRDGVGDALAWANVLVVPSRWYENSPNVILEAQAMGVPVITANHGGMAEMVQHEIDGLLFEPGSASSLASAMRRLALDRELLVHLRANIRAPHSVAVEMEAEDAALARLLVAHAQEGHDHARGTPRSSGES